MSSTGTKPAIVPDRHNTVGTRISDGYSYVADPLQNHRRGVAIIHWDGIEEMSPAVSAGIENMRYVFRRAAMPDLDALDVFVHREKTGEADQHRGLANGWSAAFADRRTQYMRRYALSPDTHSMRIDIFDATRRDLLRIVAIDTLIGEIYDSFMGLVAERAGSSKDMVPPHLLSFTTSSNLYWRYGSHSLLLRKMASGPLVQAQRQREATEYSGDEIPLVNGAQLRTVFNNPFPPIYPNGPEIGVSVAVNSSDGRRLAVMPQTYDLALIILQALRVERDYLRDNHAFTALQGALAASGIGHVVVEFVDSDEDAGLAITYVAKEPDSAGPGVFDWDGAPALLLRLPLVTGVDHYEIEEAIEGAVSAGSPRHEIEPGHLYSYIPPIRAIEIAPEDDRGQSTRRRPLSGNGVRRRRPTRQRRLSRSRARTPGRGTAAFARGATSPSILTGRSTALPMQSLPNTLLRR